MLRHIAPNVFAPYLIVASTLLSTAVLVEASLAYLGLSVPPPAPSWGRMLQSSAQLYALTAPHLVIIPGLAIALLVLAFNLFGDALRDVLDPRLRGGR
jgi:peptide/nickel transport system permease protein